MSLAIVVIAGEHDYVSLLAAIDGSGEFNVFWFRERRLRKGKQ
jgi:hypothetical protein